MSLKICFKRALTTFWTYIRAPSSMRTQPRSVGSSSPWTRFAVTINTPVMFLASLCFTLCSFSILFLLDALNGFSFRARWDYIVRIQQMFDCLLLFSKKLALRISLRSNLIPLDVFAAL